MKRIYNQICRMVLLACIGLSFVTAAQAQNYDKVGFNIGWQIGSPINTDFADNASCYGMNFEVNYKVCPRVKIGGFFNFQTNHNYIERQTIALSSTESLTTDQLRSAFQLPFGLNTSYTLWDNKVFKPYLGAKIGAMYAKATTYYGTGGVYDKAWGFFISPEIGAQIYPFKNKRFGLQLTGYYSYATNKIETLTMPINGQSNAGFRAGLLF